MRLHALLLLGLAFTVSSVPTSVSRYHAQTHPSFAGTWTRTDTAPPTGRGAQNRRGDMGSIWGSPLTIAQSADSLVVTFTHFSEYDLQPKMRYAYALTGAESRNAIMIGHAESEQRSRASWSGDTLIVTTTQPAPNGPDGRPMTVEVRQALVVVPSGTLLIETRRGGVMGGPSSTVRSAYAHR